MRITPSQLARLGACADQLGIFRAEWPDGAEVTLANCLRAADLDFGGAARHLLSRSARAEYDKVRAAAQAEYDKACAMAFFEAFSKGQHAA
jgi:hypothetical protein